jgi:hypothetical protein
LEHKALKSGFFDPEKDSYESDRYREDDPPWVDLQHLGEGYFTEITSIQNYSFQLWIEFCKDACAYQNAYDPSEKGIQTSLPNRSGQRAGAITQDSKSNSKNQPSYDGRTKRSGFRM